MDYTTDSVGRMFCEHGKDFCDICCVDHRLGNRAMEEAAGLRKKETKLEETARMYAVTLSALRGMETMHPRPSKEVFEQHYRLRDEYEEKIREFSEHGMDVTEVLRLAHDNERNSVLEVEAVKQLMARSNPGKDTFEVGGEEWRKATELLKGPKDKDNRADDYTCSYCGATGTKKLSRCARCKKASYCSKECQVAAWPAHRKNECVKADTEARTNRLTWDQVEAHSGQPASGTLEVKAIIDETMMRQVFQCKDRVGKCRRIAAYTDSRSIPGLRVGATVKWKKPRFHYFMDGSCGARIEQEDLVNITVT